MLIVNFKGTVTMYISFNCTVQNYDSRGKLIEGVITNVFSVITSFWGKSKATNINLIVYL